MCELLTWIEHASAHFALTPQLQSQFQRFLNQTLCVFSQIKDIKHIRGNFHSLPWVMPQGLGLGVAVGQKFIQFSEQGHVAYQIKGDEQ